MADPTPVPVTNDDKLSSFAKGAFESLVKDEPNIGQEDEGLLGDAAESKDQEQAQEQAEQQESTDSDEDNPQETAADVIEFELEDGKKVTVPAEIKGHLMRDKDYRQKTMALSEKVKVYDQLSQNAQQIAVQAQQLAPYHAQLHLMDNYASQLQGSLTAELAGNDPLEYNRRQGELAILLRNRDSLAGGLHQQMANFNYQQAELRDRKLANDAPELFKEIPELQNPQERDSLGKWVVEQGLSPYEIDHISFSTTATRIAWKARQYDRMVKDHAKAKAELQTKVQGLPPAMKTSRSPESGANSKQLRQDWKKGGGKIHDPAFGALLRARLGK